MKAQPYRRLFYFYTEGIVDFKSVIILLCALHLALCTSIFAATTGKITGQVTDMDGNPLPGASIVIENTKRGTLADGQGVYFLLSIEPGYHTLVASMIGYGARRKTEVRVTSDFTTNVSFALEEAPLQMSEMVVESQRGEGGWGMISSKTNTPPVELDKTTSKYVVRANDIEILPILRNMAEFIELQAGVSIDEEGEELTVRASDVQDVAYYFDGIPIPVHDHPGGTDLYRDINRLAVQEMTVVTGGMNAEYGNAQGGIVSIVTREGKKTYHGLLDYQITPSGKKHWGENVYDSNIHRGHNRWDDPEWVAERVTLPDGSVRQAHKRLDYTSITGHYLEGNILGPVTKDMTFFFSSRWQKKASTFPGPYLSTPFNTSNVLKLSYIPTKNLKVIAGGLYDRRREAFDPINTGIGLGVGAAFSNLADNGSKVFLSNIKPSPAGDVFDTDYTIYAGITHLLSKHTFYDIRISQSLSTRDTVNVNLPPGLDHISQAVSGVPILDHDQYYVIYQDAVAFERFRRNRIILTVDLSSQVTRRHFVKTGFEVTRYNNWFQAYGSNGPNHRAVVWYGKTYSDTDFFPGQKNKGVTPLQFGIYAQDKIELDGMVINAGLRYDLLAPNTDVTDVQHYTGSPMYEFMTRERNMPQTKVSKIASLTHRIGVSHPLTANSVIRYYYGRLTQFPNFAHLFINTRKSSDSHLSTNKGHDKDLNDNGILDPAEYWNKFGSETSRQHGMNLPPEETTTFEAGIDYNFIKDYVISLTTYYKSSHNQIGGNGSLRWTGPVNDANWQAVSNRPFYLGDTRGIEFSLKRRFSKMFAFDLALNVQWADQIDSGIRYTSIFPDSLFIANGHYWNTFDIDPTTGAEIPVSLQEKAQREYLSVQNTRQTLQEDLGRAPTVNEIAEFTDLATGLVKVWLQGENPDYYISLYGGQANRTIRQKNLEISDPDRGGHPAAQFWTDQFGYHAAEGIELLAGQRDLSFYDNNDKEYWKRLNNQPDYPGAGEGNLMILEEQNLGVGRHRVQEKDRHIFGSMAFLLSTPPDYGPWQGMAVGNLRANLVYRFYAGTPIQYSRVIFDPKANSGRRTLPEQTTSGPMHSRVDLNAEKIFGNTANPHVILAVEVFNLFNQKDPRPTPRRRYFGNDADALDFEANNWVQWGVERFEPNSTNAREYGEINDIGNYWDAPREITFSVRIKW